VKARRFVLTIDDQYAKEKALLDLLESRPKGEMSTFTRTLVVLGFFDILNDKVKKAEWLPKNTQEGSHEAGL